MQVTCIYYQIYSDFLAVRLSKAMNAVVGVRYAENHAETTEKSGRY